MCGAYTALAEALKALTQGETPNIVTLPMAENEWYPRPKGVSYGIFALDNETGAMNGDDLKLDTAYEGSVDLFSPAKDGDGWVPLIEAALADHCGPCWGFNSHAYERETGLFHWEWTFEVI